MKLVLLHLTRGLDMEQINLTVVMEGPCFSRFTESQAGSGVRTLTSLHILGNTRIKLFSLIDLIAVTEPLYHYRERGGMTSTSSTYFYENLYEMISLQIHLIMSTAFI